MAASFEDIPIIILAGGLGTRLRSVVADRPKPMAEVNGRPFLSYLLGFFSGQGLKKAIISTGYQGGSIRDYFGPVFGGLHLSYSHENEPLGTGGGLRKAIELFEEDTFFAANGDSFCQVDLKAMYDFSRVRKAQSTLLATVVDNASRYGSLVMNQAGLISGFLEKKQSPGPGLINAGVYLLKRSLVSALPLGRKISLEEDLFPRLAAQGMYGFVTPGPFIDIGTPESYNAACHFFDEQQPHFSIYSHFSVGIVTRPGTCRPAPVPQPVAPLLVLPSPAAGKAAAAFLGWYQICINDLTLLPGGKKCRAGVALVCLASGTKESSIFGKDG